MKKNVSQGGPRAAKKQKQDNPANKEVLDSRKHEEQDFKGDDVTHNRKAKREKPGSKKK